MTQFKTYGQFNSVSVQGRIFNADVVDGANGKFLAVTVITNLKDGDNGVTFTFNTTNGLMKLHEGGYLPNGRIVTVTGHIDSVSETYENKAGETVMRQRPQIHLVQAQAHVGPMPTDKAAAPKAKKGTVIRPSDAKKSVADELLAEVDEAANAI